MNPTGPTYETEFVFRRFGDAIPQTLRQYAESEIVRAIPFVLCGLTILFLAALAIDALTAGRKIVRRHEVNPAVGWFRWLGVLVLVVTALVLTGYGPSLQSFDYRAATTSPVPWHQWVSLVCVLIPALLTLLPLAVYYPALSQESLQHHTASRAILRAFAGTAGYLALISFLYNYFLIETSQASGTVGASSTAGGSSTSQAFFWTTLAVSVAGLAAAATYFNYLRDVGWRSGSHWFQLAAGLVLLYGLLGGGLTAYYYLNESITGERASWTALFLAGVLAVPALIALTYPLVPKSMNVYWATVLAGLRINVLALLAGIFLLPSCQTWERTQKRSRVIMLIDVTPSMQLSDEIAADPAQKMPTRLDKLIDLLTDDKVALIHKLIEQNPVYVYRFGTRLDEETHTFAKGEPLWSKDEWNAFVRYDFRSWLLRGLSAAGQAVLRQSPAFASEGAGSADWAMDWLRKPEDEVSAGLNEADREVLRSTREKLEKRVDVARSIVSGTNVPDSILSALNRESSNMLQGLIVLSDGRSNLGSDRSMTELKERASREQVPIFTITVGEDRQTVAITITDIVAPETAPPDEPFKIVVEADGVNLANQTVEVKLGLYLPSRDPKKDAPDHELTATMTFPAGDPPHGSVEFVVDPSKLPDTMTEVVKEASGPKRKLKEGPWSAVARIAKDPREIFAAQEHIRERSGIQVLSRPLRVLLVASGPVREYQTLRTMLVREVKENRAELSILVQNESGTKGEIVQDVPPERLLTRFPYLLETQGQTRPEDKYYNLNEYDLIIAFDPDWSEVPDETIKNIQTWVNNLGGGLILVADNHNTFQLARAESNSRLSPLLEILPVIPDDIVVQQVRPIPKTPRRLLFKPPPDSDLLKLDDDPGKDDPTAGWEMFFTRREKYVPNEDKQRDLNPTRGFFSSYPVKLVKPGAQVLANLADIDERGDLFLRPWLVVTQPATGRTAYLGSPELYRLRALDPVLGPEYHQRFWINLARYVSANRNAKAARGRVLLSKEYLSGSPIRVQARVLDPKGQPYRISEKDIKFQIFPLDANGDRLEREDPSTKQKVKVIYGPYPMTPKKGAGEFDGYYQAEVIADARLFPPGDNRYRVVIEVPDSSGETIEGEFMIRKSDPELDRRQPDPAAMLAMASEFDSTIQTRVGDDRVRETLLSRLKREGGRPKLAFHLQDRDLISLIPSCIKAEERNFRNRGPIQDLWDRPAYLTMFDQEIRLLDFQLTRERCLFVLYGLLGAALGIAVLRGAWEVVSSRLPVTVTNLLGASVVGLLVAGSIVPYFLGVPHFDGWACAVGLAAAAWLVLIGRLNFGPAYITLAVLVALLAASLLLMMVFVPTDDAFTYALQALDLKDQVQVGVALLAIVGLLSTEWLTRKMLRLA